MHLEPDQANQPAARAVKLPAQESMRPVIVPMLGTAIGVLYVLIHNLLSLI